MYKEVGQWNEVRVPGAQIRQWFLTDNGFLQYHSTPTGFSESLSSLPGTECFETALINNRGSSPYIISHLECHNTFHLSVAGKVNTITHKGVEIRKIHKIPWRRAWQPTPVFLPGESRGQRSLAGYIQSIELQRGRHDWSNLACTDYSFSREKMNKAVKQNT